MIGPTSDAARILRLLALAWVRSRQPGHEYDEGWVPVEDLMTGPNHAVRTRLSDLRAAGCDIRSRLRARSPRVRMADYRLVSVPPTIADALLADVLSPRHRALLSDRPAQMTLTEV